MPTFTVTDADFATKVLASARPVMVDFWGPACGPCIMLAPILEELSDEYAGRLDIATLDVSENPATVAAYGVISIPTIAIYVGGEVVRSFVGGRPKRFLTTEIEDVLAVSPTMAGHSAG